SFKLPGDSEGNSFHQHRMIFVGNDPRVQAGSLGPEEARVYEAAFQRALEEGIPIHYASESSGARIGFPGAIFRALRRTQLESGEWMFWATEADLNEMVGDPERKISAQPLRDLIVPGERVTVDGVEGFRIG